jgi:hypothetical protein
MFSVTYELNSYILFGRNSVPIGLKILIFPSAKLLLSLYYNEIDPNRILTPFKFIIHTNPAIILYITYAIGKAPLNK